MSKEIKILIEEGIILVLENILLTQKQHSELLDYLGIETLISSDYRKFSGLIDKIRNKQEEVRERIEQVREKAKEIDQNKF